MGNEKQGAASSRSLPRLVRPLPSQDDKRRAYTLHFNAVSSDRPDMFYDKVLGLQHAIDVCDDLMNGPCSLVPSRRTGTKAWVCASVKAPGSWNPSKTVDHGIAVYCNFERSREGDGQPK